MSASFNEDVIANSYHVLWEEFFAQKHNKKRFETYIPYNEEVHVGYDLGFALPLRNYNFRDNDFFEWMKHRIRNTVNGDSAFLMAYFYQYKVLDFVNRLSTTRNKVTKTGLINRGYAATGSAYRAKLYTERVLYSNKTKRRPFSQHEALCRLAKVKGAEVYYSTPKFLEHHGIPDISVRSLSDLTLTQVTDKTPTYRDSETHYLYFQTVNGDNAAWCSEPIAAEVPGERDLPPLLTPRQLFQLMKANYLAGQDVEFTSFKEISITEEDLSRETFYKYLHAMPECSRFVAFSD